MVQHSPHSGTAPTRLTMARGVNFVMRWGRHRRAPSRPLLFETRSCPNSGRTPSARWIRASYPRNSRPSTSSCAFCRARSSSHFLIRSMSKNDPRGNLSVCASRRASRATCICQIRSRLLWAASTKTPGACQLLNLRRTPRPTRNGRCRSRLFLRYQGITKCSRGPFVSYRVGLSVGTCRFHNCTHKYLVHTSGSG